MTKDHCWRGSNSDAAGESKAKLSGYTKLCSMSGRHATLCSCITKVKAEQVSLELRIENKRQSNLKEGLDSTKLDRSFSGYIAFLSQPDTVVL